MLVVSSPDGRHFSSQLAPSGDIIDIPSIPSAGSWAFELFLSSPGANPVEGAVSRVRTVLTVA